MYMIKKFNVKKTRQMERIDKLLSIFYKKPATKTELCLKDVKNILVIDFALIGDMIMSIPFFRTIRYNCPKAKITMVCMPWAEVILGDQCLVDEFIIFDGKDKLKGPKQVLFNIIEIRKVLKRINKKQYQIALEPKGDLRHILFMHYTNSIRMVTYNYTGGKYLVTDSFEPIPETKHLIDEKVDLLRLLGFEINEKLLIPTLCISNEMRDVVSRFIDAEHLNHKIIIGIHPGASNRNKQYRFYPEVVRKISKGLSEKVKFCIFEGSGEEDVVNSVCNVLEDNQYIRVKMALKEYVSIVSICNYMICNDSAAGHIAAAYGIPSLIIFGPVNAETAEPRGNCKIINISKTFVCKPCTLPTCPLKTEACIKSIRAEEVIEKIVELVGDDL